MPIAEETFNSLPEFILKTCNIPTLFDCHPNNVWFRGVADSNHELLPGVIWRGIRPETEESMVGSFLRKFEGLGGMEPRNGLEAYVLMQHYGLPTRLLDWTVSALVALYFSLETEKTEGYRAVWAMSASCLNKISTNVYTQLFPRGFQDCHISEYLPVTLQSSQVTAIEDSETDNPISFTHPYTNNRLRAQSGCFTFHGKNKESISECFERNGNENIIKLILEEEVSRKSILNQLYTLGYKEDDIYQDLNALSRRITREHSLLFSPPTE